jgi:hypothetical protein
MDSEVVTSNSSLAMVLNAYTRGCMRFTGLAADKAEAAYRPKRLPPCKFAQFHRRDFAIFHYLTSYPFQNPGLRHGILKEGNLCYLSFHYNIAYTSFRSCPFGSIVWSLCESWLSSSRTHVFSSSWQRSISPNIMVSYSAISAHDDEALRNGGSSRSRRSSRSLKEAGMGGEASWISSNVNLVNTSRFTGWIICA